MMQLVLLEIQLYLHFVLQITGCLFHWNQALDNQISNKGLLQLRKKCPPFAQAVHLIKAGVYKCTNTTPGSV